MKATFVKRMRKNFRGEARLYKVEPSVTYTTYGDDGATEHVTNHVIVSAVTLTDTFAGMTLGLAENGIPLEETFIFPANGKGDIINWGELEGSYKGDLDHERALRQAGYTTIE